MKFKLFFLCLLSLHASLAFCKNRIPTEFLQFHKNGCDITVATLKQGTLSNKKMELTIRNHSEKIFKAEMKICKNESSSSYTAEYNLWVILDKQVAEYQKSITSMGRHHENFYQNNYLLDLVAEKILSIESLLLPNIANKWSEAVYCMVQKSVASNYDEGLQREIGSYAHLESAFNNPYGGIRAVHGPVIRVAPESELSFDIPYDLIKDYFIPEAERILSPMADFSAEERTTSLKEYKYTEAILACAKEHLK